MRNRSSWPHYMRWPAAEISMSSSPTSRYANSGSIQSAQTRRDRSAAGDRGLPHGRQAGRQSDSDALRMIGKRSRGTPRVANRLLRRVRDYAHVRASGRLNVGVVEKALSIEEVESARSGPDGII